MISLNDISNMMELMDRPAFCVSGGLICCANRAALARQIPYGAPVEPLLGASFGEYRELERGCLYLTLAVGDIRFGASVTKIGPLDVFTLEPDESDPALRAYALAARALREPLNEVMTIADDLDPDPDQADRMARLNRGLYQLLRLVGNMSLSGSMAPCFEMRDVSAVAQELFDHAAVLCESAKVTLQFTNLPVSAFSMVDSDLLSRGIYSLLSNSLKYAGPGGSIDARLVRRRNTLYLTIRDSGSLDDGIGGNLFDRFRREPGIEDGRHGIGLGLMLARTVAAAHGGTLLLDQPQEGGVRVTLSLPIRQDGGLRSPVRRIDYAGERDPSLIELSESLPPELYSSQI